MTILLTRSDVERLLDLDDALDVLRAGFRAGSDGVAPIRARTDLPGAGTATALLPGLIDGVPAYTVKVNAKFPGARPALRGVVCLHDLADGQLLAVLDSSAVTAWRTGLAAALATHELARPDADVVGVVGAGAQATMVIRGLARLRAVRELVVHDTVPERSAEFPPGRDVPARVVDGARDVAAACGIVVLATWSRVALLDAADVPPGTHVTSLGADEPGKIELTAALLTAATTVVDDRVLAARAGALAAAGLGENDADATFGEVLRGEHRGRANADEVTVYAPIGLPWQDLALAWSVFRAARAECAGAEIDFLA